MPKCQWHLSGLLSRGKGCSHPCRRTSVTASWHRCNLREQFQLKSKDAAPLVPSWGWKKALHSHWALSPWPQEKSSLLDATTHYAKHYPTNWAEEATLMLPLAQAVPALSPFQCKAAPHLPPLAAQGAALSQEQLLGIYLHIGGNKGC